MDYNHIPEPPPREGSVPWIKRFGAGAFTLSLLVHAIFILIAIFFIFQWVNPPVPPPSFQANGGGGGGNEGQTANKVQTQMRRAASTATTRRAAIEGEASFTLPDNPTEMVDPGLPNLDTAMSSGSGGGGGGGHGGGIGSGNGKGNGPGTGTGPGVGFNFTPSPFGNKTQTANALEGHLYDFKQNEKGVPVEYNVTAIEDFANRVIELQKRGFRDLAFNKYFKAPDTLYLSQLVIKPQPAETGPSFFGAADKVKPSGWLAHYTGTIKAPKDMTFRFVGSADDYISVFSKGRPRLIACRPEIQATMQERWEPGKTDAEYAGPMGTLIHGDWIHLKKDETMGMDLSIAERPGGIVGFLLLIEEKDGKYQKDSTGRPITPIFTTEPITPQIRERVTNDFAGWAFDWENVPVFGGIAKDANDPFK
ncbi:MAG: hypothetical protein JWO82_65 [Akkermansiaceae bacterium]|nr:hypothetical protein [Akkermansiaceae bacterium]